MAATKHDVANDTAQRSLSAHTGAAANQPAFTALPASGANGLPDLLGSQGVTELQHTFGNHAVTRLLMGMGQRAAGQGPSLGSTKQSASSAPVSVRRMFELAKKEYYSQTDIDKNKPLTKYLQENDLYAAAVKLADDEDKTPVFKTQAELKEYLKSGYAGTIAAAKASKNEQSEARESMQKALEQKLPGKEEKKKSHQYNHVQSWGHTFDAHGPQMAGAPATQRAAAKGKEGACGVWLDQAGAVAILQTLFAAMYAPDGTGLFKIPVDPKIGVEYKTDGTAQPCKRIFYKFSDKGGFLTAFPTNQKVVHKD